MRRRLAPSSALKSSNAYRVYSATPPCEPSRSALCLNFPISASCSLLRMTTASLSISAMTLRFLRSAKGSADGLDGETEIVGDLTALDVKSERRHRHPPRSIKGRDLAEEVGHALGRPELAHAPGRPRAPRPGRWRGRDEAGQTHRTCDGRTHKPPRWSVLRPEMRTCRRFADNRRSRPERAGQRSDDDRHRACERPRHPLRDLEERSHGIAFAKQDLPLAPLPLSSEGEQLRKAEVIQWPAQVHGSADAGFAWRLGRSFSWQDGSLRFAGTGCDRSQGALAYTHCAHAAMRK